MKKHDANIAIVTQDSRFLSLRALRKLFRPSDVAWALQASPGDQWVAWYAGKPAKIISLQCVKRKSNHARFVETY